MLNTKQKVFLRSMAQTITSKYQIGKNVITPEVVEMLSSALDAHELIKIKALKSVDKNLMEISLDLAGLLKAEVVQIIGHSVIMYRENTKKRIIKLP